MVEEKRKLDHVARLHRAEETFVATLEASRARRPKIERLRDCFKTNQERNVLSPLERRIYEESRARVLAREAAEQQRS